MGRYLDLANAPNISVRTSDFKLANWLASNPIASNLWPMHIVHKDWITSVFTSVFIWPLDPDAFRQE